MLRSRGRGRLMNPRRITLTLGAAAGAAFAAALISVGTAPSAGAVTGADVDPFGDLFGTGGINSWTTMADTDLAALSPTLAGDLDMSVDNYIPGGSALFPDNPFTLLALDLDPSAFSGNPDLGGLPDNAIGDLAVGLDYTLFASGIGIQVDPFLDGILSELGVPGFL
jgi:hypothetical protein